MSVPLSVFPEVFAPWFLGSNLLPAGVGTWLQANQALVLAVGIVSTVLCLSSLLLTPTLVARMPRDYLQRLGREESPCRHVQSPGRRWATLIVRNFLGGLLLLMGFALAVLPGPGWLFILLAFGMMDFPAKRRLVVAILGRPAVLGSLNWLRRRYRQPELLPPV